MVKSEVAAILRNPLFWTTISSYLSCLTKPYSGVILFRGESNFSWPVQSLWRWHSPWKQLRHFVLIATTAWSNLLLATLFDSRHNALCVIPTWSLISLISYLFLPNKATRKCKNLAPLHKMGNTGCFSPLYIDDLFTLKWWWSLKSFRMLYRVDWCIITDVSSIVVSVMFLVSLCPRNRNFSKTALRTSNLARIILEG